MPAAAAGNVGSAWEGMMLVPAVPALEVAPPLDADAELAPKSAPADDASFPESDTDDAVEGMTPWSVACSSADPGSGLCPRAASSVRVTRGSEQTHDML